MASISMMESRAGARSSWYAILADDRRYWGTGALVVGLLSAAKGFRLPSLWAATQAQLDYSVGFTKRGLFGEVLHGLGISHGYRAFALTSYLILIVLLAALAVSVRRSPLWRSVGGRAIVSAFAASYGITYVVHLVGYLDVVLLILALVAISAAPSARQLWTAALCATIGILVHELYLFAFVPLTLLPVALAAVSDPRSRAGRCWPGMLAVGFWAGIVTVAVAWQAGLTAADTDELKHAIRALSDFPLRDDVFDVMERSFVDNLVVMDGYAHTTKWWGKHLVALPLFVPAIAFFAGLAVERAREALRGRARWTAIAAILIAALSPLSLHVVGWDVLRWDALAVWTAFLALVVVYRVLGISPSVVNLVPALRNAVLLLVVVGLISGGGLMDNSRIRVFPYVDSVIDLMHWKAEGYPLPTQ